MDKQAPAGDSSSPSVDQGSASAEAGHPTHPESLQRAVFTHRALVSFSRRWRRSRRYIIAATVTLLAGATILAPVLFILSRRTPSWWTPPDPASPMVQDLAAQLESRVVDQLHRVRPSSDEWSVSIPQSAVNAWLAARLPQWLANQNPAIVLPQSIGMVQIHVAPGEITLAGEIAGGRPKIAGLTLAPRVDAAGLWTPAHWTTIGGLSLPSSWTVSSLPTTPGNDASRALVLGALAGRSPLTVSPVVRLADGRRVRLLEIRPVDGAIEVVCQTLPASGP
ncbi:MAG: hypothetical protein AABZ53_04895 [Planctomycetota bacterium]|mgnify:CR=1 FL=1